MPAVAVPLRFRFTVARAPHGYLVHAIRSATGYWRAGRLSTVYVTFACGYTSPHRPRPEPGPITCRGCQAALHKIANRAPTDT